MADLLAAGVAWLDGVRLSHLASEVTYRRGAETLAMVATLGSTTYEVATEDGLLVQAKSVDFILTAANLILGGVVTTPQLGDRILITLGGVERTFEVLNLGGTGHYRASDAFGTMLRIHTKEIA